ncbi:hypothetical protein KI688_011226 [Linnemannia hyalina]|uniref:Crinkler effector protein N-terminal domain-containing protein n=1 Tax=Linnemannia hyalina TaxID=64524 RepID=A0A9P7XX79_9FUNG|nr:hypothetical protein KI688_011226 [Linnemannia hyalina]
MTDNLTLYCLVDGEPVKDAFKIRDIPSSHDVDDLKDAIVRKKPNDFRDVDANKLSLSCVSIHDDGTIHDKTELNNPRALLSTLFAASPDDNTYIIVQRPPQAQASVLTRVSAPRSAHPWDRSRSVSPIQLKSVPVDLIEKELAVVLKGVDHHHINHAVDPKAVESSQRKRLGPFYKRTLPYHNSATETSLVMLGLELDKQARTSNGETLCSIVEDDIGKFSGHRVVAMVAPSGSGKTATVIDLAAKHFVVYSTCCSPGHTVSPDFKDPNFVTLAKDVERIYMKRTEREPRTLHELLDLDSNVKALAGERVELEFLARFLFLQLLLNDNPDLEPIQFFREQTTGGASTICEFVQVLREYNRLAIQYMLDDVQTKLQSLLVPKRLGLVIALDEAQVAVTHILSGKLLSPSALMKSSDVLFDSNNQIRSNFRRGFLTPLSATLSNMQATLVILGTALTLQVADPVYMAIAKPTNFSRITDFPQFDENDVDKILADLVDMSDCEIPPAKRRKLRGRARFSVDVVKRLATPCSSQDSKQAALVDAVDKSIEHTTNGLRVGVRTILERDNTGEAARLLSRMVLAYHLQDAKISFSSQQQVDFVDKALCRLRPHSDDIHLILDEPMVVEAVEAELRASCKDPSFLEYMDELYRIVTNFGMASTSKGDGLEPLVRRSLQRFNGYRLVDLPFLRGVALPKWCDDLNLQIDGINTANGFGYTDSGIAADLAFLADRPPNKMLIANFGTRPNGAWFFSDNQYAGSLAIKFYSNSVPQKKHNENETSSDIRACFLKTNGTESKNLAGIRRAYVGTGTPSNLRGILRIHLEFPDVDLGMPATHVKTNPATGDEDVMVYINLLNMDDFFFEGISEHKDDMVWLKKLIRFVCQK